MCYGSGGCHKTLLYHGSGGCHKILLYHGSGDCQNFWEVTNCEVFERKFLECDGVNEHCLDKNHYCSYKFTLTGEQHLTYSNFTIRYSYYIALFMYLWESVKFMINIQKSRSNDHDCMIINDNLACINS